MSKLEEAGDSIVMQLIYKAHLNPIIVSMN